MQNALRLVRHGTPPPRKKYEALQYQDFHLRCDVLAADRGDALFFRNNNIRQKGKRSRYALWNMPLTSAVTKEGWGIGSLYADDFQVPAFRSRLMPARQTELGIKSGD